jgi:hypothetical protein
VGETWESRSIHADQWLRYGGERQPVARRYYWQRRLPRFTKSPLKITGEARGTWFFEASFPVTIVNWDGLIIGQGIAQAKPDPANPDGGVNWMTENFVPFEAELKFTKPDYKNDGAIIFQKDNPSGLPANDASCEVLIIFV